MIASLGMHEARVSNVCQCSWSNIAWVYSSRMYFVALYIACHGDKNGDFAYPNHASSYPRSLLGNNIFIKGI